MSNFKKRRRRTMRRASLQPNNAAASPDDLRSSLLAIGHFILRKPRKMCDCDQEKGTRPFKRSKDNLINIFTIVSIALKRGRENRPHTPRRARRCDSHLLRLSPPPHWPGARASTVGIAHFNWIARPLSFD